jgi:hypothetical protein
MIGDISERDKVLKFWDGSRPIIQKGLWRDNLNPEVSSWEQVTAQAEIIEISENIAERRDRKAGSSSVPVINHGPSQAGGSKGKNRSNEGTSVRSVSFETRQLPHLESRGKSRSRTPYRRSEQRDASTFSRERSVASRGGSTHRGRSSTPRSHASGSQAHEVLLNCRMQRAELLAAGKCFICKEPGHFSRDCRTKKTVKSLGNKPPGTTSFNIEPVIEEHESDDFVEIVDSLPVGAIYFEDQPNPEPESSFASNMFFNSWADSSDEVRELPVLVLE